MKLPQRKTVIKYAVTCGVALVLGGAEMALQLSQAGSFFSQTTAEQMRFLCDAFTVPGMLIVLSGLMMLIAREGALDGLSYLGHYLYHLFIPGKRGTTQGYSDYVSAKQEKRKEQAGTYGFLFVVGGACLAISLIFLGLFYHFYGA